MKKYCSYKFIIPQYNEENKLLDSVEILKQKLNSKEKQKLIDNSIQDLESALKN